MSISFLDPMKALQSCAGGGLGKVIDIGSGSGGWNQALEKYSQRIVSLDQHEQLLRIHPQLTRIPHHKIVHSIEPSSPLPFKDNSFDSAVISNVMFQLSHETKEQCIKEVKRILRPGGKVIVADWNPYRLLLPTTRAYYEDREHVLNRFTQQGFTESQHSMYTGDSHYGFVLNA